MNEQTIGALLVFWSAANTMVGCLILYILRDLRDRVTHLERRQMGPDES